MIDYCLRGVKAVIQEGFFFIWKNGRCLIFFFEIFDRIFYQFFVNKGNQFFYFKEAH